MKKLVSAEDSAKDYLTALKLIVETFMSLQYAIKAKSGSVRSMAKKPYCRYLLDDSQDKSS